MIETITRYELVCDGCHQSFGQDFPHADAAHYTAIMRDWKTFGSEDNKRKYYCPSCCEKLKI